VVGNSMQAFRLVFLSLFWLALCATPMISRLQAKGEEPPRLISGLGHVHHPVSTKNRQAQRFFDQGLALLYGFNHSEARRSFEQAAKLDPKLAMAWWGVALTLGPNYNLPVDPESEKSAYDAIQRALALQENASEPERAYIKALATRYSNDRKADLHALDVAYKNAMAKLTANYPDDDDAATLYAESMMDLNPWHLWTPDGKPAAGTQEIVAVLESVLKRDPDHLGANHYYIHAVEASPNPERALPSAARFETLAPAAGHLVHMPAHVYARVGYYNASVRCNERAAAADRKFLAETHERGVYPLMYYSHNLHFLAYADCMRGDFEGARSAAARLVANVVPGLKAMPDLEVFLPTPMIVLFTFERWHDILKLPAPDPSLGITNAVWHSLRGVAFANLGKAADAENEQKTFRDSVAKIPSNTMYGPLNTAAAVFKVHDNLLAAAIAQSRHDDKAALDSLRQAVAAEDALNYDEPPEWYPPLRPMLGRALMAAKQFAEAEKVLRASLDRHPRYPRALEGLRDSLKAEGHDYEADLVDQQLRAVSKQETLAAAAATRH
jgi:tetratricopeptide (TPR) repeat protein